MRYLSVCSGIEAATVAWHPLGWTPVAFSEIEPFPSAVLAHHYPNVPNYGDMTKFEEWPIEPGTVDLLVGGTPCQSFSVAGLRKGISDPRGGLMLTYLEIARRFRPRWIVWENVPGVLSSGGGRDFGSLLGGLEELGYGWAYRVLDAQWVRTHGHPRAVPQRRRRVFVVGCLGDPARAAQVLFERESVQRDSSARGKAREGVAADAEAGARAGRWPATVASTLNHAFGDKLGLEDQHALHGAPMFVLSSGQANASITSNVGPSLDCLHEPPIVMTQPTWPAEVAPTLNQSARGTGAPGYSDQEIFSQGAGNLVPQPVAFSQNQREEVREVEVPGALAAEPGTHQQTYIAQPVPYDLFQITAPVNRQNRKPGDPCHTLARDNAAHAAVAFDWQKGNDVNNPRPSTMNVAVEHSQTIGTTRTPAVAFTPGNLSRGAGPSPNAEVAPTQRCSAGRGADDQRTCVAFSSNMSETDCQTDGSTPTLKVGSGLDIPSPPAVAHAVAPTITAANDPSRSPQSSEVTQQVAAVHAASMTVRRLTPRECERLQAFPDDYTLIPWRKKPAAECPDGPRYKALGNSMAVNCMAWIGERIATVDSRHDL